MRNRLVGITELRDRAKDVIDEVIDHDLTVVRRSQPVAVIIHPDRLERLLDRIEDLEDENALLRHQLDGGETISPDKVMADSGMS